MKLHEDEKVMTTQMHKGEMVEKCHCPPGTAGIACDLEIATCDDDGVCPVGGDTCTAGAFCGPNDICEMVEMELDSTFAASMCRNPSTEYCNTDGSKYCTHGGKCWDHIIGGSQKETDAVFCKCPPEFTGPHCELYVFPEKTKMVDGNKTSAAMAAMASVIVIVVAVMAFWFLLKKNPSWWWWCKSAIAGKVVALRRKDKQDPIGSSGGVVVVGDGLQEEEEDAVFVEPNEEVEDLKSERILI